MTLYSTMLFVHIISALLLGAALSFESLSLVRLRRVATLSEARVWINLVPGLPLVATVSLLLLLLSGGYMTARMSGWGFGWPKVAVVAMVLIAPIGAVTGKRMRAIRQEIRNGGTKESLFLDRLKDPFLIFSLHERIWLVAGIVLLMAAKPGVTESVAVIAISVMLGLLTAAFGSRRARTLPVVRANVHQ